MKKFQQGGVSVYSVPQGIVQPNIPNSPVINAPLIPVVDMSPYLNAQIDSQRRRELYDRELLRQQQSQTATDQKNYYALQDKVFGELHNPAQKEIIDQVKKDYRISDDVVTASDNGVLIKSQMEALQRAARDQRTLGVLGEVEAANKLLQRPMPQLVDEELTAYQKRIDDYFNHSDTRSRFNVKELDANYWNRPAERAIPNTNFRSAAESALRLFGTGTDFNDENQIAKYERNWAANMALQNEAAALKQEYIYYPEGSTVAMPTPKGQAIAREQLGQFLTTNEVRREQKLEDATSTAQMRRRVNPPRGRSGSAEDVEKEESAVQKNWNIILSNPAFAAKYGAMDPFEPGMEWLYDYILSRTRMSDGTFTGTNDMNTVRKELDDILKKVYTPTYNPQPTTTPSGLPVAPTSTTTTPTAPRTGSLRLNQSGNLAPQ